MDEGRKLKLVTEFRNQIVSFLDELIEQFPHEGDFVLIRIFIKDQLPIFDVIGRFIRDVLPLKEEIKQRNDHFFMNHDVLYSSKVIRDRADHFRTLWSSNRLDEEDKTVVWKWMDVFIRIAQQYKDQYGVPSGWESQ